MHTFALYLMSLFYIAAGIWHFTHPRFFIKITPPWVPSPELVNIIVGVLEILLGILLLFEPTRSYASIGIILLLIVVFPANWYHHQKARQRGRLVWPTLVRLPLQLVLIYWAFQYI